MKPWRAPSQANGYCRLLLTDNSCVDVARGDRDKVNQAIDLDLAWVEVTDLYGDVVRVRVSTITMVADASPTGIAAVDAETEARLDHEKLHGDP